MTEVKESMNTEPKIEISNTDQNPVSGSIMQGKRGLIMGVANDHSIAWGIARALASQGAELAFTYQSDSFAKRVEPLAASVGTSKLIECDVADPTSIEKAFSKTTIIWEDLDFIVHAIAYSDKEELKGRSEPKLWNFYADISTGVIHSNNVNSVSKTQTQSSSDSIIGFNSAKDDRTLSGSLGVTATRSIGEASSFMINLSHTDSEQYQETDDDYQSYGLTLGFDTVLGNQSLSPYLMLSKTDYEDDADSFSLITGIGGYFSVGERHSFSYGYSYSDSKGNNNSSDTTANETNSIGHSLSLIHI